MRKTPIQGGVESLREHGTRNAAFYLFCAFIVSYFVHLTRRIPVLGSLHFDFVLAGITLVMIVFAGRQARSGMAARTQRDPVAKRLRSEEHTSELQSHLNLVCRLLLEKKKK